MNTTPPPGRSPPAGECHIWIARIDDTDELWASPSSRAEFSSATVRQGERVNRTLVTSRELQHFVGAHYLGTVPSEVAITRVCAECGTSGHGRPHWAGAADRLDYSVAHSGGWVAVAVVGQGRVGVDLEHQVDLANLDDLASAVLNLQELAQFQTLQNTARAKFMYRMWVRKEAVLKLMGRGLAMEPQGVDVRGRLAVMGGINRQRYGPIHIRDAPAKPGYAAALASTCSVERLQTFEVTSHASRG